MAVTPAGLRSAPDPSRPAVVVLRALGLGDLLTAVPALGALADAFPRHPRLLAAPAVLAPPERVAETVIFALTRPDGVEMRELVVCPSTEPSWP